MVDSEVLRRIRQHARSEIKTEVCGVLIGNEDEGKLKIEACIAGVNAAQGGAHVTFTQDTWEHIYKIKDKDYPEARILGWYHSHPGFGVFLSDHDTFIHKNFFSSPQQVAWVYDPHTDEEGCFGWVDGRLERLSQLAISDPRGGEEASESGKPEPTGFEPDEKPGRASESPLSQNQQEPAWLRWTFNILLNLTIFACGLMVAWLLFPHVVEIRVPVPVDPQTGQIIRGFEQPNANTDPRQAGTNAAPDDGSHRAKPNDVKTRENGQPKQ
jgi:proteasome lid subunit RPN8/RPN11